MIDFFSITRAEILHGKGDFFPFFNVYQSLKSIRRALTFAKWGGPAKLPNPRDSGAGTGSHIEDRPGYMPSEGATGREGDTLTPAWLLTLPMSVRRVVAPRCVQSGTRSPWG